MKQEIRVSIEILKGEAAPGEIVLAVFIRPDDPNNLSAEELNKSKGYTCVLSLDRIEEISDRYGGRHFYKLTPEQIEEVKKLLCSPD